MPELLRQGKVYIAETPLFEIELAKGKSRFAYTVEEKETGKRIEKIGQSLDILEKEITSVIHTMESKK